MSIFRLVVAETRFRLVNSLLCLFAMVVATAMFVVGPSLIAGFAADTNRQLTVLQTEAEELETKTIEMQAEMEKELAEMDKKTKRIMRDLGVNLRIVHKDTNMASLYTDFVAVDFPKSYVDDLAKAESIQTIVHVVATLQHKIKWKDRTVLLVGTLPVLTASQKNEEKPHMIKNIERGTVSVGSELAGELKVGDTIDVNGHSLKVAKIEPEYGGMRDAQLLVHLEDAQAILDKPDMINQIIALNCKCKGDRISAVRAELEGVLPDTKVTEHKTRATAREEQRNLVEAVRKAELTKVQENLDRVQANRQRQAENREQQQAALARLLGIVTPLIVLAAAIFIALMTLQNVRERRGEIGVWRALGKGSFAIALLFLGKAAMLGLAGGAVGAAAGALAAPAIGHATLGISADLFETSALVLLAAIFGAPLIAALASYLPTLSAVTQDPAVVLMDN